MSEYNPNQEQERLAATLRLPQLGSPKDKLEEANARAARASELQQRAAAQGQVTQEVIDEVVQARREQVRVVNDLAAIMDLPAAMVAIDEAREAESARVEVLEAQETAGAEASRVAAQQHNVNSDRDRLNQTYYQKNQNYLTQAERVQQLREKVETAGFFGKFWYGSQLKVEEEKLLRAHQQTLVATQQKALNTASLVDELENIRTTTEAEFRPELVALDAQIQQSAVALQAFSRRASTINETIGVIQGQLGLDSKYVELLQQKAQLLRTEMGDNLNIAQNLITSVLQEANYDALQANLEEANRNRESRTKMEESFERFKNKYGVSTEFSYNELIELARNGDQEAIRLTQQWANARSAETAGINSLQAALFAQGTPGVEVTPLHETTIELARTEVDRLNRQVYQELVTKYDLKMSFEEAMNSEKFAQTPAYAEYFERAVSLENPDTFQRIQVQIDAVRESLQRSDTVNAGFERGVISIENISEYFDDPEVKERFRPYLDELTMQMLENGEFDDLDTRIQDVNTDLQRIAQERAELALSYRKQGDTAKAQQTIDASANFLAAYMQQQLRRYQSNRLPEISNMSVKYSMPTQAGTVTRNVTLDLSNPEDWKLLFATQEASAAQARSRALESRVPRR